MISEEIVLLEFLALWMLVFSKIWKYYYTWNMEFYIKYDILCLVECGTI